MVPIRSDNAAKILFKDLESQLNIEIKHIPVKIVIRFSMKCLKPNFYLEKIYNSRNDIYEYGIKQGVNYKEKH